MVTLSVLGTIVFVAFLISSRRRITVRGAAAYLLALGGVMVFSHAVQHEPGQAAFIELGVAATLLMGAAFAWGKRVLVHSPAWITAPATVTAVEPVTYLDAVRWRIRFAYVDREGVAQESADEVVTGTWKPGDPCLAVFQPGQPDLATMRTSEASHANGTRRRTGARESV